MSEDKLKYNIYPTSDTNALPISLIDMARDGYKVESIDERERSLLMTRRQALIMELGAIEEYLGLQRSIIPKHKRE